MLCVAIRRVLGVKFSIIAKASLRKEGHLVAVIYESRLTEILMDGRSLLDRLPGVAAEIRFRGAG